MVKFVWLHGSIYSSRYGAQWNLVWKSRQFCLSNLSLHTEGVGIGATKLKISLNSAVLLQFFTSQGWQSTMVQAKLGEEEYSLVHSGIFGPDWQRDPQNFKIWSKLPFCSGFFAPQRRHCIQIKVKFMQFSDVTEMKQPHKWSSGWLLAVL